MPQKNTEIKHIPDLGIAASFPWLNDATKNRYGPAKIFKLQWSSLVSPPVELLSLGCSAWVQSWDSNTTHPADLLALLSLAERTDTSNVTASEVKSHTRWPVWSRDTWNLQDDIRKAKVCSFSCPSFSVFLQYWPEEPSDLCHPFLYDKQMRIFKLQSEEAAACKQIVWLGWWFSVSVCLCTCMLMVLASKTVYVGTAFVCVKGLSGWARCRTDQVQWRPRNLLTQAPLQVWKTLEGNPKNQHENILVLRAESQQPKANSTNQKDSNRRIKILLKQINEREGSCREPQVSGR